MRRAPETVGQWRLLARDVELYVPVLTLCPSLSSFSDAISKLAERLDCNVFFEKLQALRKRIPQKNEVCGILLAVLLVVHKGGNSHSLTVSSIRLPATLS